ncbi:unnamed protein product [Bursaphelenchus okinawaensis]|uniref:Pinin/SDK/MemA protein domain-containing protein n=1 Tax=Bursaphelenchus okinawaensis TaxID=465554 RepID=A0A811LDM7_9BILA|nr:unnamed protein product [Bursaphelenchus okinawaensis]CAG9120738.1 unnamed protein product [Bursaphelenchus okinawaensis]
MTDMETGKLDKALDELKEINDNIAALNGRPAEKEPRKPITMNDAEKPETRKRLLVRAPEGGESGKRKVVVYSESEPLGKRSRQEENGHRRFVPASGPTPSIPRRSLQSSVVLPIETKSREETLSKLKQSEKAEDSKRNRRLFGNLLMGTLDRFQKEEKNVAPKVDAQVQKQREVEKRLEASKREERERLLKQKHDLESRKRDKEIEILKLKRQNAIKHNLGEKETHFGRLKLFIQTQTKPPIFYLPAKHTLRSLELLKESAKNMDTLIEKCREVADRDLREVEVEGEGSTEEIIETRMYTEIKEATYVLTSFIIKQVPRQKVAWFAEAFANHMLCRVFNYYVDPTKLLHNEMDSNGYWVIVNKNHQFISPVVIQATIEVALGGGELMAHLPSELAISIKIGEVKARINGKVSLIWKDMGCNAYSPVPWPVLRQSLSERTVMVLSYDQKIRSDFIPLELVDAEKVGHNFPLVGVDAKLLNGKVKMFRAAGPARFVFTALNFACTRFGNRRRRSKTLTSIKENSKNDLSIRRASQEMVPCEERSHFFSNNWWNNFLNSAYFLEALGHCQRPLSQFH